jgi:hypothetical protein
VTIIEVVAFDPGGTTGWSVLSVDSRQLVGITECDSDNPLLPLHEALITKKYGPIDCGTKQGETGVGVRRGHGAQNILGEEIGVDRMLKIAVQDYPESAIVTEDFILDMGRADMSRDILLPVRIMARLDYGLHYQFTRSSNSGISRHPLNRFFVQNRSLAKTTCTDTRLKNWGLYDKSSGPHARDAMRHGYYFLRSCRGNDPSAALRRHLAWPQHFADPAGVVGLQQVRTADADGIAPRGRRSGRPKGTARPAGTIISSIK